MAADILGTPFDIDSAMPENSQFTDSLRVAVPCYGDRVLPRFGVAREFIFAKIEPLRRTVTGQTRALWDPQQPHSLAAWLRHHHVAGVLCGGIHPRFQIALEAEGLWVVWGFRGDIDTVLRQWLSGETSGDDAEEGLCLVTCCGLPRRSPCIKRLLTSSTTRRKPR
jgi:predicted Fe-Mo cluster-binding NifX family protein